MLQLAHKNLEVYKVTLLLVKEIYRLTLLLPPEERFTLVVQLRKAAISVCSNIAEGSSRSSKADRKRFYEISRGSVVEISTQFEVSSILEYLRNDQLTQVETYLESVFRMLSKMINNLKT